MNFEWQPIETLPWEIDTDFDEDSDYRRRMHSGIILRRPDRQELTLVGDNIAGNVTTGCSCCSQPWSDYIQNFDGWAWAVTNFDRRRYQIK